ncbi:hypothetical protein Q0F99_13975 [Rathayibacter oskolensis]|uniref:hypothetical protein n=1 Tax=Rathayibacter oskolensis TaxID=1891671 RepID=UPI00265D76B4|nr:hypothetical protein [Rathayibacter oskolensis]WKK70852.1 hypothetical protein Q0F99_13975 [Rathayibacter oskolensis]
MIDVLPIRRLSRWLPGRYLTARDILVGLDGDQELAAGASTSRHPGTPGTSASGARRSRSPCARRGSRSPASAATASSSASSSRRWSAIVLGRRPGGLRTREREPGARRHAGGGGRNKAEVFRESVLALDPDATVDVFPEGPPDTALEFAHGADLVIDETEVTTPRWACCWRAPPAGSTCRCCG